MYNAIAADDVILRADALCRTEESAFFARAWKYKEKQVLRCAQNDDITSLYSNDENALCSESRFGFTPFIVLDMLPEPLQHFTLPALGKFSD